MLEAINWHSCLLPACSPWRPARSPWPWWSPANIVRMAFYLVVSLAAVAGLFFLAGADFLGAVQLMVYVGGTLVLLVFGVMLTARGPFVSMTGGGQWIMAAADRRRAGGRAAASGLERPALERPATHRQAAPVRPVAAHGRAAGPGPVGRPHRPPRAGGRPGRKRGMSGYLLAFEIISVHLLVVLVGAAYLARAKRDGREVAGRTTRQPRRTQSDH